MDTRYPVPERAPVLPTDPAVPKTCTFAAANEVLKTKQLTSATHVTDWELMGGTLMTVDGRDHLARRRLQGRLFRPDTLQAYEHDVLQPAIDAAMRWAAETHRGADGVVRTDLVRLGRRIMLSISATVIGLDDAERNERRERLGDCLDYLIEGILVEWSELDHGTIMESARKWKEIYSEEFVRPSLDHRREPAESGAGQDGRPLDLVTVLIGDESHAWGYEEILRECILYLVASALTTSTAMTHTVGHLEEWFAEHPEDRALVADTDFLRAAAMESLRLHPGPHILLRRAPTETEVAGVPLAEGEVVGAEVRCANFDTSAYGSDADRFNPRREVARDIPRPGLTFGGGPHACIGRPLALGTYGKSGDHADGILVRMLRGLYGAGVESDPADPAEKAVSVHDRYARYPVVLWNL
jgi:cytochrome P450